MRYKRLLGFRRRARVGVNVVMVLIVLLLIIPLWYVLNNAFKVEKEILRRPLVLLPSAVTLDSLIRSFKAMKYPSGLHELRDCLRALLRFSHLLRLFGRFRHCHGEE